ncbi:uncharacterized protein THITE_2051261 [Thermothielavioides terrestris NRRL 8126]|uniref:FAD-binding domain-containing protein n=1 Tax=Thermothielavioides terrestris (strain ATCC 38088 / NRRL 8126) TaxID=578455 RepID=G2R6G0_THETT|nr:uncharacterized protein THITE_2051261 [Thermothielavioides terrestris NRRL 8126]AEO67645.1 hypothetical protein THITE_2051261 [Thermothielavioides terrestris NRRL 8126]
MHAIIVGAGPAGLAAALALHQQSTPSSPIRVTVLELRPNIQTLGGAVNLTPIAMRYLDALGVGARLRPLGVRVPYIEMLSHRTGRTLGRVWPDVDALRVLRQDLVEALVATARAVPEDQLRLRYGVTITHIEEKGDAASPEGSIATLDGDILLGCDGIHSVVRSTYVDPARRKTYSGRASAYGFITVREPGRAGIETADGSPAVNVSSIISGRLGSLLVTFFEPSRTKLYLTTVIARPEPADGGRDGRRAAGEDMEAVRQDFLRRFRGGKLAGVEETVQRCEEWVSFPVYMLPAGGVWSKGRALLLGDAAHASPPQGESSGLAIEDGVLLAHVFSRRDTRSVPQLFADYEALRRDVIKKAHDDAVFRWEQVHDRSWFGMIFLEWLTIVYVWFKNSKEDFGRDVRELPLPA